MIKKIILSIKKGSFFEIIKNKIEFFVSNFILFFMKPFLKINNDQIMFLTFQGNYNCNARAIADELIKQKKQYKIYWAVRETNLDDLDQYPKELIIVRRHSFKFHKAVVTSKIIFDNSTNFAYMNLKKRKGQIVLQTWHGSMGFKRLDPGHVHDNRWVKKANYTGKVTDYCITNSKYEEDVFKESYWPNTPFLKYGHARNDLLFNKNNEFDLYGKKVREFYNIDKNTKIALYAPTFRDNYSFKSYDLDYEKLLKALKKRFGGKWVILVRFHFRLRELKIPKKYDSYVINATDYNDIQELLCVSDVGITDYSSWLCDYVLTNRPGFLYASDIQKYIDDERGFYYPLSSTPFPVAESNDELYDKIVNFDEKKYLKEVDEYLKRLGCYEKGNASSRIVKKIEELIGNE